MSQTEPESERDQAPNAVEVYDGERDVVIRLESNRHSLSTLDAVGRDALEALDE